MARKRRLLLATAALTTSLGAACGKPIHGNPKGSHYAPDAGAGSGSANAGSGSGSATPDAGAGSGEIGPGPEPIHSNPKGAFYDDGLAKPPSGK